MSGFAKSAGVSCPVLQNQQEFSTAIFENECTNQWVGSLKIFQTQKKTCTFQDWNWEGKNTVKSKFHCIIPGL